MYKIYTDTPANLSLDYVEKHDLTVIPLHYTIGDVEYPRPEDHVAAFDGKPFYEAMRRGEDVHTSMINTHAFTEAFTKSLEAGYDVIFISISSGVSGTYHAATVAGEELKSRYPERKIAVIDTKAASLAEGLLVQYAVSLKEKELSFEKVVSLTEKKTESICQYFTVEDLIYLKRGGRLSAAAALVGNILHIKPILMGDQHGKIVLNHKVRGRKRALEALANKYNELVSDLHAPVGITHADSLEDAALLAKKIRDMGQQGEILIDYFEPVTGSHAGPGAIALFFYGIHR
jgi:DegV family protein with EDD domain